MMTIYKQKGFDLVLTDDKTLVRTNLQVFLLHSAYAPTYIREIRNCAERGEVHDMNELCGMFYNEDHRKMVDMMPTRLDQYV